MAITSFSGSTILVTGANRGIGKAIVDYAVANGASKVYAGVRRLENAQALSDAHGAVIVPLEMDLSYPATLTAAASQATDVDIVINNAGVLKAADLLSSDVFDSMAYEFNINVGGLLHMAQAFAPVLAAREGSVFAQLNSVASFLAFADFSSYCASKAAAYSYTQSLRVKLGEKGVRVLSVHPGPIATDMASDAGLTDMATPASQIPEAIAAALADGSFHVFTDPMAKDIGAAYQSFAENVIEADLSEA